MTTTVDEVSFDLIVRGKHHKPVLNLQPSQLAVTDGGSSVPLTSLHLVDAASGSEHLAFLVFDRLDPDEAKAARKIAAKILGEIPETGYAIAVLRVEGRLHLVQTFTADRSLVLAAATQATSSAHRSAGINPAEKELIAAVHGDALTPGADGRAKARLLLAALERSQTIVENRHTHPSLAALEALVDSSRFLTGRKFLFYFSAGVDGSSDARDLLRSIMSQANRAGVTVWVVDTGRINERMSSAQQANLASSIIGKGPISGSASAFGASGGGFGVGGGGLNSVAAENTGGFAFGNFSGDQSPLASLAFGTGGMYIGSYGSHKHQLRRLHEDLTSWYEATWKPPIKSYDGQFRPVIIRSLRKHVKIRARSGYFAVPLEERAAIRPFEIPLMRILAAPALPSNLAFHAEVLNLGVLPDADLSDSNDSSGELIVQVPVSRLESREDATTRISLADAAILAVIKDSNGTVVGRFGEDFPLHEAPNQMQSDGQAITLEEHFSAAPGRYTLETAVMDRLSNKAGAQRSTFTIEAPPHGPALGGVALVKTIEPDESDNQGFDPMYYEDGRVVPNLSADLPQGTRSLSLFFLVHPVAGSHNQPALRMRILLNGRQVVDAPLKLDKVSGDGAAIPYLATIHGGVFTPGKYQVQAVISQDGETAFSSSSFTVEGTIAASGSASAPLMAAGADNPDAIDPGLVSKAVAGGGKFVVTEPRDPLPAPTEAQTQAMIAAARERALAWSNSLVNFLCDEVTQHFAPSGLGNWKLHDTLVERVSYIGHHESRTTLLLNGNRSSKPPDQLKFAHSAGEFGAMFDIIFAPSAKAVFTWKRHALLDGQPVEVFAFKVARAHSGYDLVDRDGHDLYVGFHGLLYLDPATESVRRIQLDADDIPSKLLVRAASISIDYSWVAMQDHDFLLPVRGAVSFWETRRRPVLNEFEFHDYHRFGSETRIITGPPNDLPKH